MATRTISTKPFPGRIPAWDVRVNGEWVGVVRERVSIGAGFIGISHGKIYGPYPSKVEAVDAIAEAN